MQHLDPFNENEVRILTTPGTRLPLVNWVKLKTVNIVPPASQVPGKERNILPNAICDGRQVSGIHPTLAVFFTQSHRRLPPV